MEQLHKQLYNSVEELLRGQLVRQFTAQLDALEHFANEVETHVNAFWQAIGQLGMGEDAYPMVKRYQKGILERMQHEHDAKGLDFYQNFTADYWKALSKVLSVLPEKILLEQPKERFLISNNDRLLVRTAKFFKRLFFFVNTSPKRFLNLFRSLFNKPLLPIPYWKYHVPFRNLAVYHYEYRLGLELQSIINEAVKQYVLAAKSILHKEEALDKTLAELLSGNYSITDAAEKPLQLQPEHEIIKKTRAEFGKQVEDALKNADQAFLNQAEKAGTIERPAYFLRNAKTAKNQARLARNMRRQGTGWGNTLFALFDDWKLDQELYYANLLCRAEKKQIDRIFHEKIEAQYVYLTGIEKEILALKANFREPEKEKGALRKKLVQQKYLAGKQLVQSVSPAVEYFVDQNFAALSNRLDATIERMVSEIAQKRWLTKYDDYDAPIKDTDLNPFSPHELISFESIPTLNARTAQVKAQVLRQSEKILTDIDAIGKIVEFNLDSAINTLDTEDIPVEEINRIADEGVSRAASKIQEIRESLKRMEKSHSAKMEEALEGFCQSLVDLTVNENAFNLRMRLTTAKTLRKTEDVRKIVLGHVRSYAIKAGRYGQMGYAKAMEYIEPWRRRAGLYKGDETIDTALSDFLNNSQQIINQLPVVYQRLYKTQPLSELSLFVGREAEIAVLQNAYNNWQKERYASTVVVGERWSGMTTLIHYFMEKINTHREVIKLNPEVNFYHAEDFFALWKTALENDQISSVDDITDALNTTDKKRIIILENIQNLYLRTIHGFECMKMLCEIISKTNKQNFWLCSASLYSWNYLEQTMQLGSYFGYIVSMEMPGNAAITEIIIRRNNISGYMIRFEPAAKNLQSKKYLKLDDQERQEFLKDQFFDKLNAFAKGNISLALIFWLLSTKNITEDTIEISNFEEPDFSFMKALSNEKVLALFMLILHDGLTLELFAEVFSKPIEQSKLLLLLLTEDGILINRDGVYMVNPLLYRQMISLLKSRNFIY